jgi:hypothetical protein
VVAAAKIAAVVDGGAVVGVTYTLAKEREKKRELFVRIIQA